MGSNGTSGLRFSRRQRPANGGKASRGTAPRRQDNHFDRKLEEILCKAAEVFCARGYHQASVRDISRATRVSLAGLYYYFRSKEELLYLIQRHAFETILATARAALEPLTSPEERLRALIRLHLQFFLEHPNEMKVLTHEEEGLGEERGRALRAIKKAYYKLCFDQVEALKQSGRLKRLNTRVAVLSLFGMMNWIYTWYKPRVDPDVAGLAEQMTQLFLYGVRGFGDGNAKEAGASLTTAARNGRRTTPSQARSVAALSSMPERPPRGLARKARAGVPGNL